MKSTFIKNSGLLLAAIAMVMAACHAQSTAKRISVEAFEKTLNEKNEKVILDVRTPDEYKRGHLAGAVLIDYYSRDFKEQLNKLDKSKAVLVYCATGGRSSSAASVLSSLGFKEVYDMQGGLQAWMAARKPIVK